MMTIENLRKLSLASCLARLPSAAEVMEWFALLQAGWVHDGDSKKPHVELHSKKHSNGFFLCKRVLDWGNLREILAACIVKELRMVGLKPGSVQGVFGSPYSSILLAGDVGRLLGVKTYIPEKDPSDSAGKRMLFKSDDPVPHGALLLQVEELVTTFDSGDATKQAIIAGNPFPVGFAPFVGTLVHRPPSIVRGLPDGRTIVPFIERQVDAWEPADCPLCKAGSAVILPKKEWAKLVA